MLKKHWKLILEVIAVITIALGGCVLYYAREAHLLDTEPVDAQKSPIRLKPA